MEALDRLMRGLTLLRPMATQCYLYEGPACIAVYVDEDRMEALPLGELAELGWHRVTAEPWIFFWQG